MKDIFGPRNPFTRSYKRLQRLFQPPKASTKQSFGFTGWHFKNYFCYFYDF